MNREKGKKGLFKIIFSRTAILILLLIIQVIILVETSLWLNDYSGYIYTTFTLISAIIVIYIINRQENPMYKLAWVVPILGFPFFGAMLYLFVQLQLQTKLMNLKLKKIIKSTRPYIKSDEKLMDKIKDEEPYLHNLATYIDKYGGYPIYKDAKAKYYPSGEEKFEDMKLELKKAKKFIFLEYFIVQEGIMWDSILEILKEKVKQGVEVRVMYDGMCSLILLPYNYPKTMEKIGIKCKMFSPIKPALSTYQNNRDHRKILVIDGKIAFTGGVNLADEYINKKIVHGFWKDAAIKIEGEAVKSFTMMFLQM